MEKHSKEIERRSRTNSVNSKGESGFSRSRRTARSPTDTVRTEEKKKDRENQDILALLKELKAKIKEVRQENATINTKMDSSNIEIKERIATNNKILEDIIKNMRTEIEETKKRELLWEKEKTDLFQKLYKVEKRRRRKIKKK